MTPATPFGVHAGGPVGSLVNCRSGGQTQELTKRRREKGVDLSRLARWTRGLFLSLCLTLAVDAAPLFDSMLRRPVTLDARNVAREKVLQTLARQVGCHVLVAPGLSGLSRRKPAGGCGA